MMKKNNIVEEYLCDLKILLEQLDGFLGCYLVGSYPYGYYVEGISDIDVVIIFENENFNDFESRIEHLSKNHKVQADVHCFSKCRIFEYPNEIDIREIVWGAKIANTLVCGNDVLSAFQLPDQEAFLEITLKKTIDHMKELRETNLETMPNDFLDVDDTIKPYINIRGSKLSIKQMVITVSWIATCLLAKDYSIRVASKSQAIEEYRKRYSDGEEMYLLLYDCKMKWKYLVPDDKQEVERFKMHCKYLRNKEFELLKIFEYNNIENLIN